MDIPSGGHFGNATVGQQADMAQSGTNIGDRRDSAKSQETLSARTNMGDRRDSAKSQETLSARTNMGDRRDSAKSQETLSGRTNMGDRRDSAKSQENLSGDTAAAAESLVELGMFWRASFLIELSLLSPGSLMHMPSALAAGALILSLPPEAAQMVLRASEYPASVLAACIGFLDILRRLAPDYGAVIVSHIASERQPQWSFRTQLYNPLCLPLSRAVMRKSAIPPLF
jgi:hypothetical protein